MSDIFHGSQLESGLFQRVRTWRDAIPSLVLVDSLRVAGSPLLVTGVWIVLGLQDWLLTRLPGGPPLFPTRVDGPFGALTLPGLPETAPLGRELIRGLLLAALWLVPAALIARAGACYAAGRSQTLLDHGRVVAGRWANLLMTLLIPAVAVAALAGLLVVVGIACRLGGSWSVAPILSALVALPIATVAGTIAAGAVFAVPLAIVATVIERQPDSFDAISRGYEYLLRRPVHLALNLLGCVALLAVIGLLAEAITRAAIGVSAYALRIGSGTDVTTAWLLPMLTRFASAVVWTAAWGLVGATYLVMRQATSDQEVEDITVSAVDQQPPTMPSLVTKADESVSADGPSGG